MSIEDYMLPCFSKQVFDLECPGCGIQRGLAFLIKGEFAEAWAMYPALFAIIPLFLLLAVDYFYTFKYAGLLIRILMIASVGLILSNFLLKFL